MASILKTANGWRANLTRLGASQSRSFRTKAEADAWVRSNNASFRELIDSVPQNATRRPAQLSEAEIVASAIPCNLARVSAVYFLISNQRVVYVGQSSDVYKRIASHVGRKEFDAIHVLPCPITDLLKVETDYIRKLDPPLNRAGRIKLETTNAHVLEA